MPWFTRLDRLGQPHVCYSQEQGGSCLLASMRMVLFKVNKFKLAPATTTEATLEEKYKHYDTSIGGASVGAVGADLTFAPNVLSELGLGTWELVRPGLDGMPVAIKDGLKNGPVIIRIGWASGGGHFVCGDGWYHMPWGSDHVACCDPLGGLLNYTTMDDGKPVLYSGKKMFWSANIVGDPAFEYGETPSVGSFTDLVRKK